MKGFGENEGVYSTVYGEGGMTCTDESIHILLAFDDNYAPHGAVAMNSVLQSNPNHHISFHVFYSNLSNEHIAIFKDWFKNKKDSIVFYQLGADDIPGHSIRGTDHVSVEAFFRILCAQILPETLEKIIYIDCDVLNLRSLEELWNFEIDSYALGACLGGCPSDRKLALGLNGADAWYFNSGVLLINLQYWREHNVTGEVLQFIRTAGHLPRWDQDALNAVLKGRWRRLPFKYNALQSVTTKPHVQTFYSKDCDNEERYEAVIAPVIVHYTDLHRHKAWFRNSVCQNKHLYESFRKGTPYRDVPLENYPATELLPHLKKLKGNKSTVLVFGERLMPLAKMALENLQNGDTLYLFDLVKRGSEVPGELTRVANPNGVGLKVLNGSNVSISDSVVSLLKSEGRDITRMKFDLIYFDCKNIGADAVMAMAFTSHFVADNGLFVLDNLRSHYDDGYLPFGRLPGPDGLFSPQTAPLLGIDIAKVIFVPPRWEDLPMTSRGEPKYFALYRRRAGN